MKKKNLIVYLLLILIPIGIAFTFRQQLMIFTVCLLDPQKKAKWDKVQQDAKLPVVQVEGRIIFESDRTLDGYRDHLRAIKGGGGIYFLEKGEVRYIGIGSDPRCSKDGKKILCEVDNGRFRIYDVKGEIIKEFYLPKGYDPYYFDWSPDEKILVFTSDMGSDPKRGKVDDIYIIDIENQSLKRLTFLNPPPLSADVGTPKWSPDGKKIVYSSPKYETTEKESLPHGIWVMDADGSNKRELLGNRLDGGSEPSWSPDGKTIVFTSTDPDDRYGDIYLMNSDGSGNIKRITTSFCNDEQPVFSPDSKKICFVSNRHELIHTESELFVIDIDGTGEARLTPPQKLKGKGPFHGWATDQHPDWIKAGDVSERDTP